MASCAISHNKTPRGGMSSLITIIHAAIQSHWWERRNHPPILGSALPIVVVASVQYSAAEQEQQHSRGRMSKGSYITQLPSEAYRAQWGRMPYTETINRWGYSHVHNHITCDIHRNIFILYFCVNLLFMIIWTYLIIFYVINKILLYWQCITRWINCRQIDECVAIQNTK